MDFLDELRTLREQVSFKESFSLPEKYSNVVIAGMGGSGIAGKIFQELYSRKPLLSLDDYHVPEYVDSNTVFISMSYSGNTEEVISSTSEALERGASVFAVTSGGKLENIVDNAIKIPPGLQPRSSLGYMLMPLLNSFTPPDESSINRTRELLEELDNSNEEMKVEAEKINRRELIPVVYGSSPFRAVAYRWRTQFNENAKVLSSSHYFPELDHNEIVALKETYHRKRFIFYSLEGTGEQRNNARIGATEQVTGLEINRILPKGVSDLERIFYLIHYGDYLTYHLAKLRGIDPTDVSTIEKMKKLL